MKTLLVAKIISVTALAFFIFIKAPAFSQESARNPFALPASDHPIDTENNIIFQENNVSLHFVDMDIKQALQQFSEAANLNMIISDTVSGIITVRIDNAPYEDALNLLLKSAELGMREEGNIILVSPMEDMLAQEQALLEAGLKKENLSSIQTAYVQVHYAKAESLALLIKDQKSSLLSARGQVGMDARTNMLIIQDIPSRIVELKNLVRQLDKPVPQVLIEARILNAARSFSRDLGLNFSGDITVNVNDNFQLNMNLPGTETVSDLGLSITQLSGDILLDLEISASESENLTHVIASPRLVTANQTEAVIKQGKQIAYEESTSSGATAISFKDAVLELRVLPHITPDDKIMLFLNVKQDVVGTLTETGQPTIDTKAIQTQVLVNNGETIVLGGIYSRTQIDDNSRVPFLGQLPWIGRLFQDTAERDDQDELLIFVTPRIMKEAAI